MVRGRCLRDRKDQSLPLLEEEREEEEEEEEEEERCEPRV